jgi:hypothetical protein
VASSPTVEVSSRRGIKGRYVWAFGDLQVRRLARRVRRWHIAVSLVAVVRSLTLSARTLNAIDSINFTSQNPELFVEESWC